MIRKVLDWANEHRLLWTWLMAFLGLNIGILFIALGCEVGGLSGFLVGLNGVIFAGVIAFGTIACYSENRVFYNWKKGTNGRSY